MQRIMLRTQLNDVLNAIKQIGFYPSDFDWEKERSQKLSLDVYKLVHIDTGYYFIFDYSDNVSFPYYSILFPTEQGTIYRESSVSWKVQLTLFKKWIALVKAESDIPDPWNEFLLEKKLFEAPGEFDNEPFTIEEQEKISLKITELDKQLIASEDISDENIAIIKTRLNYLEEASKRLGRKDWLNTAIGVSLGIVTQIGLSSHMAQEIFKILVGSFSNILGGPIMIP